MERIDGEGCLQVRVRGETEMSLKGAAYSLLIRPYNCFPYNSGTYYAGFS